MYGPRVELHTNIEGAERSIQRQWVERGGYGSALTPLMPVIAAFVSADNNVNAFGSNQVRVRANMDALEVVYHLNAVSASAIHLVNEAMLVRVTEYGGIAAPGSNEAPSMRAMRDRGAKIVALCGKFAPLAAIVDALDQRIAAHANHFVVTRADAAVLAARRKIREHDAFLKQAVATVRAVVRDMKTTLARLATYREDITRLLDITASVHDRSFEALRAQGLSDEQIAARLPLAAAANPPVPANVAPVAPRQRTARPPLAPVIDVTDSDSDGEGGDDVALGRRGAPHLDDVRGQKAGRPGWVRNASGAIDLDDDDVDCTVDNSSSSSSSNSYAASASSAPSVSVAAESVAVESALVEAFENGANDHPSVAEYNERDADGNDEEESVLSQALA